ncbi:MAG: efflux RND transporter permease subunit [Candidatus Omnitrophica bacterium]|nr:efflux RND transporter permease subunit [Candidatus Omnitrophota bacterium]MBU1128274.1 efflux RND transporter permease subunit [Candidatus Omnitrophota bacterium]MBU1784030.1 efflux RND transporter permease subunit [Candidatus Omnitrophota bacterium]MBU1851024.1 efflux RND transporter permease subunit [Candidatus Omnitrophota bacterium]
MSEKLIQFFLKRHLLTNLIFVGILAGGIFAWIGLPKEELPDITFDTVRITTNYPGASTEDVEYYVTEPVEEAIRDIDGVYRVYSATSIGNCTVTAEIEKDHPDKEAVISEIRNEVLDADLPTDIVDDPHVRVFKTSRKAIIDIGLIYKGKNILDIPSREKLQTYALVFENELMNLPEINSVSRSGYLKDEIHVEIVPDKLKEYNITFNTVMQEIKNGNVRQPAGSIENISEPKVTLSGELNTVEKLKEMSVQGGFEGQIIRVKDLANVEKGYEKKKTVLKINGHEGIFLNVRKNSGYGIIDAVNAVEKVVKGFSDNTLKDTGIELILLDDESFDVRNRLSLITMNGAIGFILVVIILFVFLDLRSGLWVALGIPFTFCFTLVGGLLIGYTVNNITLAAIIIVMGMVVDDAIVVAENISRMRAGGMTKEEASVKGTAFVLLPIIASIVTTCVAFVPLFFFAGRFGTMVKFIPPIVFLMLGGSLFEALFILPGHMMLPFGKKKNSNKSKGERWIEWAENKYETIVNKTLKHKFTVLIIFVAVLLLAGCIASRGMKFVMFPDEETRQIRITAETPPGTMRYETARMTQPIEDVVQDYTGGEVMGYRNEIAQSRGGSAAQENKFRIRIEILPREQRKKSADQLIKEWKGKLEGVRGIENIRMSKTWHGQNSASPIEILIKENNNQRRYQLADELAEEMRKDPALINVEIDRPMYNPEYRLILNRDKVRRLAINPSDIAKTLRASLEGTILYEFSGDEEPVYVRLTVIPGAKDDIAKIFEIPVENQGQYLVPLKDLVTIEKVEGPDSIIREDMKRCTTVYADIVPRSRKTPLNIADNFEKNIFPKFKAKYLTSIVEFRGEVKDTRESGRDFMFAVIMAVFFIYIILALFFNSLFKPFIIMLAIPFGIVGIILAFWVHGISMYGFFAVIGALGLAGVVVNDSIIMMTKLDRSFDMGKDRKEKDLQISGIAKTRLRAVLLTTVTTVVAIIPTAYGWAGYDSMLAQMMLAIAWGLLFGTLITLVLIPCIYSFYKGVQYDLVKK